MRISTSYFQQRALNGLLDKQSALSQSQQQLATGKRILAPADDPAGSAQALSLNRTISQTDRYQKNIDTASRRLDLEEQALASAGHVLQRIRQLALEANDPAQSAGSRHDIAIEIRQDRDQLLQLANTQDGQGNYLFAGYKAKTRPFSETASGVAYAGDQGQALLQTSASQQIAVGDSGASVFQSIRAGNGAFVVSPDPANAGSGVVSTSSVTDSSQYNKGGYSVDFTTPGAYEVRDASGAVVTNGSFTDGSRIAFKGVAFTLTGSPAAGDKFALAPSPHQDVFKTLQTLADTIDTPVANSRDQARLNNGLNGAINTLDRASDHFLDIRARTGARLNNLNDQKSLNDDFSLQLKTSLSGIQDVDYAAVASKLNLQRVGLQAAQQAFIKVQGLSLFNYLR